MSITPGRPAGGVARQAIAVVLAGVVGTLVNTLFLAGLAGLMEAGGLGFATGLELALKPGRYAVAIAVAAVLPFLARLPGPRAWAVALLVLTAVPSALALLVFNPDAPWVWVVAANLAYAGAATATYALVARRR